MRMDWTKLIGFCLLAAAMVMLLRQMNAQAAGLLSAAFGILILGQVLPDAADYVETITDFLTSLGLEAQYYRVMLKAMGVVLMTQIAVQVCEDMDASSIARRVELCGRLALLSIAVPVFTLLTQMAVDVLR